MSVDLRERPLKCEMVADTNPDHQPELTIPIWRALKERLCTHSVSQSRLELPETSFAQGNYTSMVELASHFSTIDDEDLYSLSVGADGRRRKLDADQLQQVRQSGTFDVESRSFPGMHHRWQISSIWQNGRDRIQQTQHAMNDHALGLAAWEGPRRIVGDVDEFSIRSGLARMWLGIKEATNILVGLKDDYPKYPYEYRLKEEISRHEIRTLLDKIMPEDHRRGRRPVMKDGERLNTHLDETFNNLDMITTMYRAHELQWRAERESRRARLTAEAPEGKDVTVYIQEQEQRMQQTAVYDMIRTMLPEGADAAIDAMEIVAVLRRVTDAAEDARTAAIKAFEEKLKKEHTVMSRIYPWVQHKVDAFAKEYDSDHPRVSLLPDMLNGIESLTGQPARLFRDRAAIHTSDAMTETRARLKAKRNPKEYMFMMPIFRKKLWTIEERQWGYQLITDKTYVVKANFVGWRFRVYWLLMLEMLTNGVYWAVETLLWGKFGLRALYGFDRFSHSFTVNHHSGSLERTSPFHTTWAGRLLRLWANVRDDRERFEARPDRGFFGKSFSRVFNVLHNYVIKLGLGVPLIVVLHPVLTILNTIATAIVIVTSFIWGPVATIAIAVWSALIKDSFFTNTQELGFLPLPRALIELILIRGAAQCVISVVSIPVFYAIALGAVTGGIIQRGVRTAWDTAMFHVIIKPRANVPAFDTFVAVRTSGPGMAARHRILIPNDAALIILRHHLESVELSWYEKAARTAISEPLSAARDFYSQFEPVGLRICGSPVLAEIEASSAALTKRLDNMLSLRRDDTIVTNTYTMQDARVRSETLEVLLEQAEIVTRKTMESRIRRWMTEEQHKQFMADHDAFDGNYRSVAIRMLKQAIGDRVLDPLLGEDERGFGLEVSDNTVRTLFSGLFDGDLRHELENVSKTEPTPITTENIRDLPVMTHNNMSLSSLNWPEQWIHIRESTLDSWCEWHAAKRKKAEVLLAHNSSRGESPYQSLNG